MLRDILRDPEYRAFFDDYWHQAPFAQPDAAALAREWMTWDRFSDVISTVETDNMLIVRDGRLLEHAVARDQRELDALLGVGCSVVIRRAEDVCPDLGVVAAALGAELDGPATVHLFASPAGHHSFGWHYDCEDVFLIQSEGEKDMYLRENTVNPSPTVDAMPKDMQFEKERAPLRMCKLLPEDWLYIPRGWWHVARCQSACLTISIGVLSPESRGAI